MRSRLEAKGYRFSSECDTEVLLVAGPRKCEAARMVERLNRGLGAPDDAPEQIADAINRLLAGRGTFSEVDLTPEAVAESESSCIVKKMAHFFSAVVRLRRAGIVRTKNPEGRQAMARRTGP